MLATSNFQLPAADWQLQPYALCLITYACFFFNIISYSLVIGCHQIYYFCDPL